jgi:hypothetical protein
MISAIETFYKGHRFRSRLEARWAVFFDAMQIAWEYEAEGYVLPSGDWYLPDFWLSQVGMFAEVKRDKFTQEEANKCRLLTLGTGRPCLMLDGPPDFTNYWAYSPGPEGETELLDFVLIEGHRYWITESRFYCSTGLGFPNRERYDEFECYESHGVLAARAARFEHGERYIVSVM